LDSLGDSSSKIELGARGGGAVDAVAKYGSVATFGIGRKASASWDQLASQAASWNRSAMNAAWALMSLPPMFRTCPFLIIAIAS